MIQFLLRWLVWFAFFPFLIFFRVRIWIRHFGINVTLRGLLSAPFWIESLHSASVGSANPRGWGRLRWLLYFATTESNVQGRWRRLFLWRSPFLRPKILKLGNPYPPILYCRSISNGEMIHCTGLLAHDFGHLCRFGSLPREVLVEIFEWIRESLKIVPEGEPVEHVPAYFDSSSGLGQQADTWKKIREEVELSLGRKLDDAEFEALQDQLPNLWSKLQVLFANVERIGEIGWWETVNRLQEMERLLECLLKDRFDARLRESLRVQFVRAQRRFWVRPILETELIDF